MAGKPETKIVYVCERCAEKFPEACGHYNADELRRTPDGEQVCESCWDDEPHASPDWNRLRKIQRWKPVTPAPKPRRKK
jgi:hypothetical protein